MIPIDTIVSGWPSGMATLGRGVASGHAAVIRRDGIAWPLHYDGAAVQKSRRQQRHVLISRNWRYVRVNLWWRREGSHGKNKLIPLR